MHCNEATLLNHVVGGRERGCGHLDVELSGGFEINYKFEFGRLNDRQLGGFGPLENLTGIRADLTKRVPEVGPIANQSTRFNKLTNRIRRRRPFACRQGGNCARRLVKNESGSTKRASGRSRANEAKAASITLDKKRTTLASIVKRREERKQFCAFSARKGLDPL
jgi:hypothetical protein